MHTNFKLIATCIVMFALTGCVTTPSVPLETLSADEKALHDLMARRLEALGKRDVASLEALYVDGSAEPQQLATEFFPRLVERPWTYRISETESFVVLSSDALARFMVGSSYDLWSAQDKVVAIYEKQGSAWKLSSVTLAR